LHLAGDITLSKLDNFTAAPNSFIIRNSTTKTVAYINITGDLVLSGKIYVNWTQKL